MRRDWTQDELAETIVKGPGNYRIGDGAAAPSQRNWWPEAIHLSLHTLGLTGRPRRYLIITLINYGYGAPNAEVGQTGSPSCEFRSRRA